MSEKNQYKLANGRGRLSGRSGRRIAALGVVFALTVLAFSQDAVGVAASVPPSRQADNVAVITIGTGEAMIDSVTAQSFIRRLRIVEESGADAFVVEINTPGGEIGAVLDICGAIKGSSIENSVAWINTKAYSGGAIIALACDRIIISSPATMGDALPIGISRTGGLVELPPLERGKLMIPLISEVIDSARRRNNDEYVYDEYLVQGVILGIELWWVQNNQTGQRMAINRDEYRMIFGNEPTPSPPRLGSASPGKASGIDPMVIPVPVGMEGAPQATTPIDAASPGLAAVADAAANQQEHATRRPAITPDDSGQWTLIEKISDGSAPLLFSESDMRHYRFADNDTPIRNLEDIQAWFGASEVETLTPLWSEGMVRFLTSIYVRGLLIVVFLLGMFIEMVHPGLVVPASIAVVALAALVIPPYIIGMANWWEIVAILLGILLILGEIFVFPGFGVPGIAGLVLLFLGLVGTFIPDQGSGLFPNSPSQQRDMLFGAMTVLLATATALGGMWFISRRFATLPILRHMMLGDPESSQDLLMAMGDPGAGLASVGERGLTLTVLRPIGRVEVDGRVIDATAESGYIDVDRPVRVVSVSEFVTIVAEDSETA